MKTLTLKSLAIIGLIGVFLLFSGCVTQPKENLTVPATTPPAYQSPSKITPSPTSANPYWIKMAPIGSTEDRKDIHLNGTTNLPAGTEITVGISMLAHSCPPPATPDAKGSRSYCGGTCTPDSESSERTVTVVEGTGRINTWNTTINTSAWCWEIYEFGADANNWTNVTRAGRSIHFGTNISI
jgi:hypothetical protein